MNPESEKTSTPIQKKVKTVIKRNGQPEEFDVTQVFNQLKKLSFGLNMEYVNLDLIVKKVELGLYDGIKTTEIDNLAAETAAYMNIVHPHYSLLAARITVNNLHKETKDSFAETISDLYHYTDKNGKVTMNLNCKVFRKIRFTYC
jgi:Ribonucleotide reductase, alpha subunit